MTRCFVKSAWGKQQTFDHGVILEVMGAQNTQLIFRRASTGDVDQLVELRIKQLIDEGYPEVTDIRADLHADPDLARLHEQAVAWRRRRFDELMKQEPYRALFARLMMTPPSRPIGAASARGLTAYANRGRKERNE